MKYELFTRVSLRTAIAKHKLKAGEGRPVVEHYPVRARTKLHAGGFNAIGEAIAVVTLRDSEIEPLAVNEALHVAVG